MRKEEPLRFRRKMNEGLTNCRTEGRKIAKYVKGDHLRWIMWWDEDYPGLRSRRRRDVQERTGWFR
jgi:hypothetical protein